MSGLPLKPSPYRQRQRKRNPPRERNDDQAQAPTPSTQKKHDQIMNASGKEARKKAHHHLMRGSGKKKKRNETERKGCRVACFHFFLPSFLSFLLLWFRAGCRWSSCKLFNPLLRCPFLSCAFRESCQPLSL